MIEAMHIIMYNRSSLLLLLTFKEFRPWGVDPFMEACNGWQLRFLTSKKNRQRSELESENPYKKSALLIPHRDCLE